TRRQKKDPGDARQTERVPNSGGRHCNSGKQSLSGKSPPHPIRRQERRRPRIVLPAKNPIIDIIRKTTLTREIEEWKTDLPLFSSPFSPKASTGSYIGVRYKSWQLRCILMFIRSSNLEITKGRDHPGMMKAEHHAQPSFCAS